MVQIYIKENSITLLDYKNRSVIDRARDMENKYAVRLIELIMTELPTEMKKWTPENVHAIYQALIMTQHTRDGERSAICCIQPEIVQKVIQCLKASDTKSTVSAAMSSIKRRNNRRIPIQDSDGY